MKRLTDHLKRVKMISTEIVSEKEMQEQQEAQAAEQAADSSETSPVQDASQQ